MRSREWFPPHFGTNPTPHPHLWRIRQLPPKPFWRKSGECSDAGNESSLDPKVAGIIEIGNQYFLSDQSLTWQPTVWTHTKSEDTEHYKYSHRQLVYSHIRDRYCPKQLGTLLLWQWLGVYGSGLPHIRSLVNYISPDGIIRNKEKQNLPLKSLSVSDFLPWKHNLNRRQLLKLSKLGK